MRENQLTGQGLVVPSGNQRTPIDLSSFNLSNGLPVAVHVVTTTGRVSSALLDSDGQSGRDFILAMAIGAELHAGPVLVVIEDVLSQNVFHRRDGLLEIAVLPRIGRALLAFDGVCVDVIA